jgi:hypothetical protein
VAVALIAATVAIHHANEGHKAEANAVAPSVVAKEPAPVRPPDVPQSEPARISIEDESPKISPEDEAAFASFAESEVSQLREGITLAQWLDLHGTNEGWAASTDENFFDCRTFVKTETLQQAGQTDGLFLSAGGADTCRFSECPQTDQDGGRWDDPDRGKRNLQNNTGPAVNKIERNACCGRTRIDHSAYAPTDSRYDAL